MTEFGYYYEYEKDGVWIKLADDFTERFEKRDAPQIYRCFGIHMVAIDKNRMQTYCIEMDLKTFKIHSSDCHRFNLRKKPKILKWDIVKILMISHFKEVNSSLFFQKLPTEIFKIIFSFCEPYSEDWKNIKFVLLNKKQKIKN